MSLSIASNYSTQGDNNSEKKVQDTIVLPCSFYDLNEDTLFEILGFVGNRSFLAFVLDKIGQGVYEIRGHSKETYIYGYGSLHVLSKRFNDYILLECKEKNRGEQRYDTNLQLKSYKDGIATAVVYYSRKDILTWVIQERHRVLLHQICREAAKAGSFITLREVFDKSDKKTLNRLKRSWFLCSAAAGGGKLEILKFLRDNEHNVNCEWDPYACTISTVHGHLKCLRWLIENGCMWSANYCLYQASKNGRLEILKYLLLEKECEFQAFICSEAARNGHIDILRWLRDDYGYEWDGYHHYFI